MGTHSYTRALVNGFYDIDVKSLAVEIIAALPGKTFRTKATGVDVDVVFDATLTGPETTTLGTAVTDHQAAHSSVSLAKTQKHAAIDKRTRELITAGFEYPGVSGVFFSLSGNAQRTLIGSDNFRADLVYPVVFNSIDDAAVESIADATEMHAFVLTGVKAFRAHADTGTSLKDDVRAAVTVAAVNAIVDAR